MKQIKIFDYNSNWKSIYKSQSDKIKYALKSNLLELHHIGSTSIPGLASKNKIDIAGIVSDKKLAINTLSDIGYEYRGEWNVPFKIAFRYRKEVSVNLHLFDFDHPDISLFIFFRDYLTSHNNIKDQYQKLKSNILKNPKNHQQKNINSNFTLPYYTIKKSQFIKDILKKSNVQACRILRAADVEESLAVKYFQKQIINLLNSSSTNLLINQTDHYYKLQFYNELNR